MHVSRSRNHNEANGRPFYSTHFCDFVLQLSMKQCADAIRQGSLSGLPCPNTRDNVHSQELVQGRIGGEASNLVAVSGSRLFVGE